MVTRRVLGTGLRVGGAAAVLLVLVQRFGADPFVRAVDRVTVPAVLTAVAVTAMTTACCAWRWSWTARRLGLFLDVRAALPAYYRSQFLNLSLPGGVLGDVHRAVRHGADGATVPRAARAVAWERALGQVGLIAVAAVVMVVLPSVVRNPAVLALGGVLLAVLCGWAWLSGRPRPGGGRVTAVLVADFRRLAERRLWFPLLLSVVAASGHLVVLMTAMQAAGVDVPMLRAVPLLLAVLVGSSLPTNLAGWGPREGMAAWVFAAAGTGAADGVTVAAVYGVLSFVAALPGALLIMVDALPRRLRTEHA